jgi:hypothetical protein
MIYYEMIEARRKQLSSLRTVGVSSSVSKPPGAIHHRCPAASSLLVAHCTRVDSSIDLADALREGLLTQLFFCSLFKISEPRCSIECPNWNVVHSHPVGKICVHCFAPNSYDRSSPRAESETQGEKYDHAGQGN